MDPIRNFGFLLTELSRRYVLRFEQRARDIFLTLAHCKTLVELARCEGLSQIRLAELAKVEPMAMVRILDHMEAGGLLERRPDPDDRRARRLYLTGKAKPLLEQVRRIADLTRSETFEGVKPSERDAFIGVLERIHGNLCSLDGEKAKVPAARAATPAPRASAAASRTSTPARGRKH